MDSFVIITNNPHVVKEYPDFSQFFDTNVAGVIRQVRDMVHMGAKILSHPLCGSIKPWVTPYKSVVISNSAGPVEYNSLRYVEGAAGIMAGRKIARCQFTEEMLEDFGVIDLDIIRSAIEKYKLYMG